MSMLFFLAQITHIQMSFDTFADAPAATATASSEMWGSVSNY